MRYAGLVLAGLLVCSFAMGTTSSLIDFAPGEYAAAAAGTDPNWRGFNTYVNTDDGIGTGGEDEIRFGVIFNGGSNPMSPSNVWGGVMNKTAVDVNSGPVSVEIGFRADENNPNTTGSSSAYNDVMWGFAPRDDVYNEYTYARDSTYGSAYWGELYYAGDPINGTSGGASSAGGTINTPGYPVDWDNNAPAWWNRAGGPGPYAGWNDGVEHKIKTTITRTSLGHYDLWAEYWNGSAWQGNVMTTLIYADPNTYVVEDAPDLYVYAFCGAGGVAAWAGHDGDEYIALTYVNVTDVPEPTSLLLVGSLLIAPFVRRRV